MKTLPIIMNAADHAELSSVIAAAGKLSDRARAEIIALRSELERAEIVAPNEVPPDVITMNSRAELLDLGTNERMEFTLVYPAQADIEEGKISILAPLGTAMLGYRVGDEFEWAVPYGYRHLRVTRIEFQPEATLHRDPAGAIERETFGVARVGLEADTTSRNCECTWLGRRLDARGAS